MLNVSAAVMIVVRVLLGLVQFMPLSSLFQNHAVGFE